MAADTMKLMLENFWVLVERFENRKRDLELMIDFNREQFRAMEVFRAVRYAVEHRH